MFNPHSQALRGYDYLGLSRITFPLYQALWQTRRNQTVAMATGTSFGASQSPAWQNGVLSLVTVPSWAFSEGTQGGRTAATLCSRLTCLLSRPCRGCFYFALFDCILSLS